MYPHHMLMPRDPKMYSNFIQFRPVPPTARQNQIYNCGPVNFGIPTGVICENREKRLGISKTEMPVRIGVQISETAMPAWTEARFSEETFLNCDKKSYRIDFSSEKLERLQEKAYYIRHENQPAIQRGEHAEANVVDVVDKMRIHFGAGDSEPMCLISRFEFENYLNSPSHGDPTIPKRNLSRKQNGEHDVLILHLNHGVTFIQVKAIGEFKPVPSSEVDWKVIKKRKDKHNRKIKDFIERALKQLEKDVRIFHRTMNDLNLDVPVRKVLALPNIRRETLANLKSSVAVLTKSLGCNALDSCLLSNEVHCTDLTDNSPLCLWWARNIQRCAGFKDVHTYRQVIGRYCSMMSSGGMPTPEDDVTNTTTLEEQTSGESVEENEEKSLKIRNPLPMMNDVDTYIQDVSSYCSLIPSDGMPTPEHDVINKTSMKGQYINTEKLQWQDSVFWHGLHMPLRRPHVPNFSTTGPSTSSAPQHFYRNLNGIYAQGRVQRNRIQSSDYIECSRKMRASHLSNGTRFSHNF